MNGAYAKQQPWSHFRQPQQQHNQQSFPQSHPQLEHEYFSSLTAPTAVTEHHFSSDTQSSYPAQSQVPIVPSSTLQGAFNPSTQQTHNRTSSLPQSSSLEGVFGQPVYSFASPASSTSVLDPSAFVSQPMQNNAHSNQQHNFNFQPSTNLGAANQGLVASYLTRSPDTQHVSFPPNVQQRIPNFQSFADAGPSTNKRARTEKFFDDAEDEDSEAKEEAKAKPLGACARCKSLKVKCESRTETDPCKRCFNSGHECIIPGRKKRRAPPKRETLINEIRRQADEIKTLMAQLESLNAKPRGTSDAGTSSAVQSPVLAHANLRRHSLLGSEGETSNNVLNPETQQVIADWIAKARESFEEFDGFIAGGGLPRSYIVDQDAEEEELSDGEYGVSDGLANLEVTEGQDYDFTVENVDGPSPQPSHTNGSTLHRTPSMSSIGSAGTAGTKDARRNFKTERSAALPPNAAAFGLFSDLALRVNRGKSDKSDGDEPPAGIANNQFFEPSHPGAAAVANEQHPTPHILARGLITTAEVEKLFKIYFDKMNPSVSLLDPVMYTPARTYYRSPFLFTVVCAIASHFYTERPELYLQAMHYAQLAAGTALISGKKNVEMCAAYILLSLYPVPAKRWEDQRSWLYLGLAIRCATDLNLHIPNTAKPINEIHAREMLNRTRIWLNCFNVDRSTGSQYGKPPIIPNTDYVANHCEDWWKSSPYNMKHFDIHICAYNAELRVMAGFIAKIYNNPEHPSGLSQTIDLESIAIQTDDELQQLGTKWFTLLEQTDLTNPQNSFRTGLLKLAYSYARLGCLSYGFQSALGKSHNRENPFLLRCLNAATDVVNAVINNTSTPAQVSYLSHGPEAQSVFVTFASAFLVKLLQPKFSAYLTIDQREEIRNLVQRVIDILGSPGIAIDDRHGPKLYSRFLKGLLAAPMARDPAASPASSVSRKRITKSAAQTPERTGSMTPPPPDASSPPARSSLSPAPMEQATSFDSFAPTDGGAIDPFGNMYTTSDFDSFGDSWMFSSDMMAGNGMDMGWSDAHIPGFNLMTRMQENLGMDMQQDSMAMYNNGLFTSVS